MKRLTILALLALIGLGIVALTTATPTLAGKSCSAGGGCPPGQFCILGQCHKTIPCDIVLCAPCPEGTVHSPTNEDCCRCVPEKPKGKP